jgi:hypothetical protein
MADAERTLVKRSDKVSFFGNMSTGTETFNRMRGFTTLSGSKNPIEYSRHYVDEDFETTDVTGYSPSIEFNFDQFVGDTVHDEIVEILDGEYTGTEARRNIVTVDFSQSAGNNSYKAVKREYAIIGDAEGDSTDAYTYGGTLRATGKRITGTATLNSDNSVATFTPDGVSL